MPSGGPDGLGKTNVAPGVFPAVRAALRAAVETGTVLLLPALAVGGIWLPVQPGLSWTMRGVLEGVCWRSAVCLSGRLAWTRGLPLSVHQARLGASHARYGGVIRIIHGPLFLPPPRGGLPGPSSPTSLRRLVGRLALCWPACQLFSLNIKEGETMIWYLFMNFDPVRYETWRN